MVCNMTSMDLSENDAVYPNLRQRDSTAMVYISLDRLASHTITSRWIPHSINSPKYTVLNPPDMNYDSINGISTKYPVDNPLQDRWLPPRPKSCWSSTLQRNSHMLLRSSCQLRPRRWLPWQPAGGIQTAIFVRMRNGVIWKLDTCDVTIVGRMVPIDNLAHTRRARCRTISYLGPLGATPPWRTPPCNEVYCLFNLRNAVMGILMGLINVGPNSW